MSLVRLGIVAILVIAGIAGLAFKVPTTIDVVLLITAAIVLFIGARRAMQPQEH